MSDEEFKHDLPGPTYGQLVATPAWRRWVAAVTGSRIPVAMAPLALVYLGHAATGSFAVGSLMAGAYAIAEAACAPGSGRLLARSVDTRRGLQWSLVAGAGCMLALGALTWIQAPTAALILASAASGGVPAVAQGGLRALLQQVVPDRLREKAFVLDATLLEIQYAAGPALVAGCVALGLPVLTSVVMAVAALSSAAVISALPATVSGVADGSGAAAGPDRVPRAQLEPAWRARAALGTYVASLTLGYAEGTITVALPALLRHIGSTADVAGLILVGLSLSSAVGGWTYGWLISRLGRPTTARASLLLAGLGLLLLPVAGATALWVVVISVAAFGLLVAPINAVRTLLLGRILHAQQHAEGFSTLYGVNGLGFGISGLASAGLLQLAGPRAPLLVAGVITAIAGLTALALNRRRRPAGRSDT